MATQATKQTTVAPQGNGANNPFLALASANGTTNVNPFMYNPKTTNETSFTQTAPQDVEALVNATFQQLVGRNATAQEIQTYGQELLAAEKSNAGLYHQELSYDPTTGKAMTAQGTQVTSGIDAGSFLQNLISGSANAQSYKMATGYFDAMTQALQQQVSE